MITGITVHNQDMTVSFTDGSEENLVNLENNDIDTITQRDEDWEELLERLIEENNKAIEKWETFK